MGWCETDMERRDDVLTRDGLKFHIIEWGPASGQPLLMMHGIRGYGETFGRGAATQTSCYRI